MTTDDKLSIPGRALGVVFLLAFFAGAAFWYGIFKPIARVQWAIRKWVRR